MPQYTVKIKWGKETFDSIDVNTDEDPMIFKAQIFTLTGVQPHRQKVMCKGVTLKEDSWSGVKLTNGAMILVMGSKEEDVPKEPVEKTRFVEDMNETELASVLDLPAGLINLGNSCYMNATVQCLKTVPELRASLRNYQIDNTSRTVDTAGSKLVASLRDTFDSMEGASRIPPIGLLASLHRALPRFRERETGQGSSKQWEGMDDHMERWAQQDANECWTELVRILQQNLQSLQGTNKCVIDHYFEGKLDTEMKCAETDDEPITKGEESFLQLSCFISQDVKYLQSGLRSKMQEQITKMSSVLGRDAVFTKTAKLSRLPAYLTVQFVRFYYKEKEAINAKILKDVKFPIDLDVFELCSANLQEKLLPMRSKFKEVDDAKVEASLSAKDKNKGDVGRPSKAVQKMRALPFSFEDDVGSNNSGFYTLQGVLTHKGRSSSSGHYVAWVRWSNPHANSKEPMWLKCDDGDVTPVTQDEVLKLSGGGDWHCAYVLLYGPRILEVDAEKPEKSQESSTTEVSSDVVMEGQ